MRIEIYDPAMCCASGVCGPGVDPELVRVQEALRQIEKQAPEVQVARYGLSSEPQAFVDNPQVAELLKNEGPDCLPLVLVDGVMVSKASYPSDEQFGALLRQGGFTLQLVAVVKKPSCCCGPKACC